MSGVTCNLSMSGCSETPLQRGSGEGGGEESPLHPAQEIRNPEEPCSPASSGAQEQALQVAQEQKEELGSKSNHMITYTVQSEKHLHQY